MYIKQVALSKSNLEAVLMAVAISKGQMPRNNNIFHSYTLNLSYNLMCEMLLGWLTEMLAEIQWILERRYTPQKPFQFC